MILNKVWMHEQATTHQPLLETINILPHYKTCQDESNGSNINFLETFFCFNNNDAKLLSTCMWTISRGNY